MAPLKAMIPLAFLLVSFTAATGVLTIHPPDGSASWILPYFEANYCVSPNNATNLTFIYVKNQPSCLNVAINSTAAGKIVFTSYCPTCCPLWSVAQKASNAGAIGLLSTSSNQQMTAPTTGISTVPSVFCFGFNMVASNDTENFVIWVEESEHVTADISQPPTNPISVSALLAIRAQTFPSLAVVWPSGDPCLRNAQTVPNGQVWEGVTCANNDITELTIPFPVNGRLPNSWCNLQNLFQLVIQDDVTFTGLPFCPGSKLVTLTISGTSMASIDPAFLQLPVYIVDLSNNLLTGSLNPANWNASLRILHLQGNKLSGTLPSVLGLPKLTTLDLSGNNYMGAIPDFTQNPLLGELYLTGNKFNNWTISNSSTSSALTNLEVGSNQLSTCPQALVNLLKALQTFLINSNQLTSLPDFAPCTKLLYLDVSDNQIEGQLVLTQSLTKVVASNNSLTSVGSVVLPLGGTLPITDLELSQNKFTGALSLPSTLIDLRTLLFANNNLSSISFISLPSVTTVDFSNNSISGTLGFSIPSSLVSLDLSNNELSGAIPSSLIQYTTSLLLAGNPLLNYGLSSELPLQVSFTFNIFQVFNNLGMECPTYKIRNIPSSVLTLDPSYHDNLLCRCLPGYYRPYNVTSYCVPCLANAVCPGREDPLTRPNNANILAQFGYFPLPSADDPQQFVACRFGVVLANDPQNPCNPSVNSLVAAAESTTRNTSIPAIKFQCSLGYEDRLCSKCVAGWFRKEGRCLICNGSPEYPMFLIAIVIIFLAACLFFVQRQPVDMSTTSINPDGWTFEPKQRVYDFVPLILHFFQVSTIILTKLQSLDVLQTMNSLFVTASFSSPQSGIGFECGLPEFQGFVTQYLAVVIFPPILAVVLALFFLGRIVYRYSKDFPQQWNMSFYQYVYGLFSMFDAIHFPLVTYVLGVFQCTTDPVSGLSYFSDHPYLLCDSISPAGKVFPLLLYPIGLIGFFVCLGIYLHYAPSDVKESEPVIQCFAFFYVRFKPDRVMSGVFFIFTNLGLSLIVGLMEPNTDVFPTLIILVVVTDFFFVSVFQPYLQPRYNKVRSINDLVALLLFVNNLIYAATPQFSTRTASPTVIYIALNVGMILFYGYHLYRIVKLHHDDVKLVRSNSDHGNNHHPTVTVGGRKHIELGDMKRKHTNIDPPSTHADSSSTGDKTPTAHVYVPVAVSPPTTAETTVDQSTHSPLPIISENETSDFGAGNSNKASGPLVFTDNPLADTTGSSFSNLNLETPPSPSSKNQDT